MKINLLKNLHLKLASLLIAFILWLLVTGGGASMIEFSIPLQLNGLSSDLAIAGDLEDRVDVRLRAADTILQQLTAGQIDATINLSGMQEGEHIIPISFDKIRVPFGVEVVKVNPSRIALNIQKRIEKKVPIKPILRGRLAEGYEQVGVNIEPSFAIISGAESDIKSVNSASTEAIFLADRNRSFTASANVMVDNPNITIKNPSIVLVELMIAEIEEEKQFTDLPIAIQPPTYKINLNPDKIEIVLKGAKSKIASLEKENIKVSLNLTDLKARKSPYELQPLIEFNPTELADAIKIVSISPDKVRVRIYNTSTKK